MKIIMMMMMATTTTTTMVMMIVLVAVDSGGRRKIKSRASLNLNNEPSLLNNSHAHTHTPEVTPSE